MPDRIAPLGIAGAAADGADAEVVRATGDQAGHRHAARRLVHPGARPFAHRARAGGGVRGSLTLRFVQARVGHRRHAQGQLAGAAVVDADDRRRVERGLGAAGARGVETAGKQFGQAVGRVALNRRLHVERELAQEADERLGRLILGGGGRRAALRLRGNGVGERGESRLQVGGGHRRGGKHGVAVETRQNVPGGFFEFMVRGARKAEQDAE